MTEVTDKKPEAAESPKNPFFDYIDKRYKSGSVRELIGNAFGNGIVPWDLPEDPEELKKVLDEAVDYAVSKKAPGIETK